METCHILALELENLVRSKMDWPQSLRGTTYSADAIEMGSFVETLEFLLKEFTNDPHALEGFFVDVAENRGRPMEQIGYDICKEYLERANKWLGVN